MFSFTLRQLEVYLAVCDHGSFRLAADALGISQAAVSTHIGALEDAIGSLVFERRRGARIRLGQEGEAFRQRVDTFIGHGKALEARVRTGGTTVRIFVGEHLLEDCIRPALAEFMRRHLDVRFQFLPESARKDVERLVAHEELDCALMAMPERAAIPPWIALGPMRAGLYGNAEMATLARNRGLAALPIILWSSGGASIAPMKRMVRRAIGSDGHFVTQVAYHDVAIDMASRGVGATFALESMVRRHDPDRSLTLIQPMDDLQQCLFVSPNLPESISLALIDFFSDRVALFNQQCSKAA